MYKNFLLILFLVNTLASTYIYAAAEKNISTSGKKSVKQENQLIISDAWARKSMLPNNNSAAYMKIKNPTNKQMIIIGASSISIANNVELHESFVDDQGISRMTSIDNIVVPANSEIELKPGGIHIMLFDLKRTLAVDDKFIIKVKIEGMKPISVETDVK